MSCLVWLFFYSLLGSIPRRLRRHSREPCPRENGEPESRTIGGRTKSAFVISTAGRNPFFCSDFSIALLLRNDKYDFLYSLDKIPRCLRRGLFILRVLSGRWEHCSHIRIFQYTAQDNLRENCVGSLYRFIRFIPFITFPSANNWLMISCSAADNRFSVFIMQ